MYGYGFKYRKVGSIGDTLAAAYKVRVEADGGTYENGGCLAAFLNTLSPYSGNLLLGLYPNAAAAYSLRLLNPDYSGSAIRVRRASDNTELNIGFVSNELDTATLASFCSGTNGFVTTWYDQSGNSRNVIQATAANQPTIVSSGSVLLVNGKSAIKGNGTSANLITSYTSSNPNTTFLVGKRDTDTNAVLFSITSAGTHAPSIFSDTTGYYINQGGAGVSRTNIAGHALLMLKSSTTGTNWAFYGNSVEVANTGQNIGSGTGVSIYLFSRGNNTQHSNSYLQEAILYPTDNTSNRAVIETNINSYYGIY